MADNSNKRAADVSGRGPEPGARKQYEAGERPSEQGEGDPSPETAKRESGLQGHKG
jgi:hypothetical protein